MTVKESAENSAKMAIAHTESITGLRVTVHDLTHTLWHMLPAVRFRHAHPACQAVKTGPTGERCLAFEIDGFRSRAHTYPDGRIHRCHAGFSEVAYPVFHETQLALVLFLGPFLSAVRSDSWNSRERLPRKTREEAVAALEALRQLGARLRCIIIDLHAELHRHDVSRETRIRRYVLANYEKRLTLDDLAVELSLSHERTRHVVVEECGSSFRVLVEQTRVEAAAALLLNSRLQIDEIAARTGLSSRAALSRLFRRWYGCSPRAWRKEHQS